MNLLIALVVGLLAGAHTATWGMYKDSPHEGFTFRKYSRSIVLSGAWAVIATAVLGWDLTLPGNLVVLFGVTYALERATVEFYKTFLRTEDQSKYFIPMQFHVFGKVVHSRAKRLMVGLGYVVVAVATIAAVYALERAQPDVPRLLLVLGIGSIGGWFAAFGGAWKDAPIEGFETLKFFRSPVVAGLWAFLLSHFTDSLILIAIGGVGFSVATLETYKTFFFPSKPRGKFAGKPIDHPEMLRRRNLAVPLYVAIWIGVAGTCAAAFLNSPS